MPYFGPYRRKVYGPNLTPLGKTWLKVKSLLRNGECRNCKYFTFTPAPFEDGWSGECDIHPGREVHDFGYCTFYQERTGKLRIKD